MARVLAAAILCLCALSGEAAPAASVPAYAHDPFIAREGDSYYLFCTGQGIPVRRSRDLRTWEILSAVFAHRPPWIAKDLPGWGGDFWAPEVSFHDGLWYLYYAVSSFGTNDSRIGLATTPTLDPEGPGFGWTDRGVVIASRQGRDDWNAIDPSLVVDEPGRWRLTFGSFWSGIKQVDLDPSTGKPAADPPVLRGLARRPDAANDPIEAPFISHHGGFWYLWVSFDYCCRGTRSTYKVAVGRSRDVTGPFVDEQGRDMAVGGGTVVLQSHDGVIGPGAPSVLQDGDRDLLVHHMYDPARGGAAVLQVRPIQWVDDWPRVGEPQ